MGDRKSSKPAWMHAQKLLDKAIESPYLKDEMYLILIKQLTRNPKQSSLIRGYQLLVLFLTFIRPSQEFSPYLSVFLEELTIQEQEKRQHRESLGSMGRY